MKSKCYKLEVNSGINLIYYTKFTLDSEQTINLMHLQ